MDGRHRIVRIIMKCFGVYMLYNIGSVVRKQWILQQARIIREQQLRYGGDFQLSQQKKKVLEAADNYTENHVGLRYLNRMRTQELLQQQLTKKLKEKEDQLEQTPPEDVEKVLKLKSHIEQLQKAYVSVAPKMPTSWEDLREKDEEDQ